MEREGEGDLFLIEEAWRFVVELLAVDPPRGGSLIIFFAHPYPTLVGKIENSWALKKLSTFFFKSN